MGDHLTKGLIVGCVADNNRKYLDQALRLLQSWRWFAGELADADFQVCVVDDVPAADKALFESYGATVMIVPRFSTLHPPSNKLGFLQTDAARGADKVLLLDCDTVVVQPPTKLLKGLESADFVAKIVDGSNVRPLSFKKLFETFNVHMPAQDQRCTVTGQATIPYFNSGVIALSRKAMSVLVPEWIELNIELIPQMEILDKSKFFCEQASLCVAVAKTKTRFFCLGNEMNFPAHKRDLALDSDFARTDPVIIHYHSLVDEHGYLQSSPYPRVNERIAQFNAHLRRERGGGLPQKRSVSTSAPTKLIRPIFLVGTMRSGTTLLADLLDQSDDVGYCRFELREIWSRVGGIPMASAKTRDTECHELTSRDATPEILARLEPVFLNRMRARQGKKPDARFLNKNPHLSNKLPFLTGLFPDSQVISVHRGLPQVVGSLKRLFTKVNAEKEAFHWWPKPSAEVHNRCWSAFHGKDPRPATIPLDRIFPGGSVRYLAEYWLETNRAIAEFAEKNPSGRILRVRQEDLVQDPRRELARCFAFLELSVATSADALAKLDSTRNVEWLTVLSEQERHELCNFVEERAGEIDRVLDAPTAASQYLDLLMDHSSRPS